MTREEYVHYSECRQASFTYRKGKRFREWANMNAFIDVKPNDDILDIFGFLTYEMVSKLTTTALQIKRDVKANKGGNKDEPIVVGSKRKRDDSDEKGNDDKNNTDQTATNDTEGGLFSLPSSEETPLEPEHVLEAFRRLQQAPTPLKNFRGGLVRTKVSLI